MIFTNTPKNWQTLYPDCPIGLRITDLWQNNFYTKTSGGDGGARLVLRSQKAVIIQKGEKEIKIESLRKASEYLAQKGITANYKKISRYISSGKGIGDYFFKWA